jgi:DNA-binding transcriptional regulator LsrR (DeoR family)
VQVQANRLTGELADVTGAQPVFLPTPGLVSSPSLRRALVKDPPIGDVMKSWKELDLALVGIGSLEPSPLLRQSGNALTQAEQDQLRNAGAVGDVCLRFFDTSGATVKTPLDERVMSITPADLMQVPRRVGVAGGASKYRAIRAALRGAWVTSSLRTSTPDVLWSKTPRSGSQISYRPRFSARYPCSIDLRRSHPSRSEPSTSSL